MIHLQSAGMWQWGDWVRVSFDGLQGEQFTIATLRFFGKRKVPLSLVQLALGKDANLAIQDGLYTEIAVGSSQNMGTLIHIKMPFYPISTPVWARCKAAAPIKLRFAIEAYGFTQGESDGTGG